jgi:hypothetical protein
VDFIDINMGCPIDLVGRLEEGRAGREGERAGAELPCRGAAPWRPSLQVCDKSAGSALLKQPRRIEQIVRSASAALAASGSQAALTFKTRKVGRGRGGAAAVLTRQRGFARPFAWAACPGPAPARHAWAPRRAPRERT